MSYRVSKVQRSSVPRSRRLNKRKRIYKRRTKGYNVNCNKELVTYMVPHQMPFPPRFRTKMTCAIYGSIAAGVNTATFTSKLNSCLLPFAGGTWTGASPAIATLNPAGFSAICNQNYYTSFRVYSSKILVEFLPQALADTIQIVIVPSISTGGSVFAVSLEQPYAKSMFMSSSKQNSARGSALTNYITVHKFMGVSKRAIEDDLSNKFNGFFNAQPGTLLEWVVEFVTPDAVVTVTPLEYRAVMTYYVEFYNAVNSTFVET